VLTPHFAPIQSGRAGTTLREAYLYASSHFFPPSGRTPDESMFAAPQFNTWIELTFNQNEADILKYAHGIIDHGLPPGVLMIDASWQEDYGNWEFSTRRFSHPRAMMDQLHQMGFKVMLWVVPFVNTNTPAYPELAAQGVFLREKDSNWPARTGRPSSTGGPATAPCSIFPIPTPADGSQAVCDT
jgi:hypothetical protein